jgi:hypothetical protein
VVEEDAVAGIHAVGLAVVHRDPVGVELGHGVGAARVEGGGLFLRNLLDESVEFRGAGLIEAGLLLQAKDADRLQDPERAQRIRVGGVFRFLEADGNVALRGEVVNLVGLHLLDDAHQARAVGHVAVVQRETTVLLVRILVEVIDAVGIEQRGATLDAMHLVALVEQELGEIGTVLAGHAGDQCDFLHGFGVSSGW